MLVGKLPPDLQRIARDSYAVSLRAVFMLAACSTFLAYIVRLPVRLHPVCCLVLCLWLSGLDSREEFRQRRKGE
jgi:hypothetical protein